MMMGVGQGATPTQRREPGVSDLCKDDLFVHLLFLFLTVTTFCLLQKIPHHAVGGF
jgi:hypothetical protein